MADRVKFQGGHSVSRSLSGPGRPRGPYSVPRHVYSLTDAQGGPRRRSWADRAGRFVPPAERRAARMAEAAKVEAESVTLREWSERWLADLEANPDRSRATVVSYRSVLKNHILDDLGDIRLAALTTERVADHLASLARQRSTRHPDSRVNGVAPNVVIVLRSMLNAAVRARAGGLEAFDFLGRQSIAECAPKTSTATWRSPKRSRPSPRQCLSTCGSLSRWLPGAPFVSGSCWVCSGGIWSTWTTPSGQCSMSVGSGTSKPTP